MPLDFTPTQYRILKVLSDGLDHKKGELKAVLDDEMAGDNALSVHLTYLRKRLRPRGEDIVCVARGHGRYFYRHVRLIAPSSQE